MTHTRGVRDMLDAFKRYVDRLIHAGGWSAAQVDTRVRLQNGSAAQHALICPHALSNLCRSQTLPSSCRRSDLATCRYTFPTAGYPTTLEPGIVGVHVRVRECLCVCMCVHTSCLHAHISIYACS